MKYCTDKMGEASSSMEKLGHRLTKDLYFLTFGLNKTPYLVALYKPPSSTVAKV